MTVDLTAESPRSPVEFLEQMLGCNLPSEAMLREYDAWWQAEGSAISASIDRAGTPHLRTFDVQGQRVDEIQYSAEQRRLIQQGQQAGCVSRYLVQECLAPSYLLGYVTSFYDVGVTCAHTVSLATAHILDKYGPPEIRPRVLPDYRRGLLQGATWFTEVGGGTDLGASVQTVARRATDQEGDHWRLTGDKYFCSNVGADYALVAARPESAPGGIRGLALFLVPRMNDAGALNYNIRRLKDKIGTHSVPTGEVEFRDAEAYLMGEASDGIYLIGEVLNLSRVANSLASVALAQRALADAMTFAEKRMVFGKQLIDQPLLGMQFETRYRALEWAFALAWEVAQLANLTARELPGLYSDDYTRFRLLAHLAKFWTAEIAVDCARWAMEVHGGAGVLAENGVERWLRDAMILSLWEGPTNVQALGVLDLIARKNAHRLLFDALRADADPDSLGPMQDEISGWLALSSNEREAEAERMVRGLAQFTAPTLRQRLEAATVSVWD